MSDQRLPAERAEPSPAFDPRSPSRLVSRGLAWLASGEKTQLATRRRDFEPPIWRLDKECAKLKVFGIAGGLLIIGSFSSSGVVDEEEYLELVGVEGIDLATGAVRWELQVRWELHESDHVGLNHVVLNNDKVAIEDQYGSTRVLDARTGALLWERWAGLVSFAPRPIGNLVLLRDLKEEGMSAVDAQTGDLAWHIPFRPCDRGVAFGPGRLYLTDSWDVVAVDFTTGKVIWTASNAGKFEFVSHVRSDGATVVACLKTYDGEYSYMVLDAETGEELWGCADPVACIGSTIFVRHNGSILACDARTGHARWRLGSCWGGVFPWSNGKVICGHATLVDLDSGTVLWQLPRDACPYWRGSLFAPALNLIAVTTKEGEVIGFTTHQPTPAWRFKPELSADASALRFVSMTNLGEDPRLRPDAWLTWERGLFGFYIQDAQEGFLLVDDHNLYLLNGRSGNQVWRSPLALSGIDAGYSLDLIGDLRGYWYHGLVFVYCNYLKKDDCLFPHCVLAAFRQE